MLISSIISKSKLELLTSLEKQYFIDTCFSLHRQFPFVISVNLTEMIFYWCSDMTLENGILGAFTPFRPNSLFLSPLGKDLKEQLVSTVIHELTHKHQFETFGPLYFLMAIPGIREYCLEKEARYNENLCDEILAKYPTLGDRLTF